MSGYYEPTQAYNTTTEGKQCEGKFAADLGHKMETSGYFRVSLQVFRFKVTSINMISIFL